MLQAKLNLHTCHVNYWEFRLKKLTACSNKIWTYFLVAAMPFAEEADVRFARKTTILPFLSWM